MNAIASRQPRRLSNTIYRWVRQFHLWIGAWGALAAILYGFTGLVLNHRMGENAWPQGKTTPVAQATLDIPAEARATPEQLSLWLRDTRKLDATTIRKGGPGGPGGFGPPRGEGRPEGSRPEARGQGRGEGAGGPQKWTLSGGTAGNSWSLEYTPGNDTAELKHSHSDLLAALNRLHKGVGGFWWVLLADSFAIGMLLLGISGIWMWARGRSASEVVVSVMGVAVVVFVVTVGLLVFG